MKEQPIVNYSICVESDTSRNYLGQYASPADAMQGLMLIKSEFGPHCRYYVTAQAHYTPQAFYALATED